MRVLVVSPYLPHSQIGHGGGISTYHFLRTLATRHEVTLLCFARHGEAGLAAELEEAGVDVEALAFPSPEDPALLWPRLGLDRLRVWWRARHNRRPAYSEKYRRSEMRRRLRRHVLEGNFDVVQFEYEALGPYVEMAREWLRDRPRRPQLLLNTHEAGSLPRTRKLERRPNARAERDLRRWNDMVRAAIEAADRVQCVTEQDRRLLCELTTQRERLITLPFGVDAGSFPASRSHSSEPRLLFVGSFAHGPNIEAARQLSRNIHPALRERHPSLRTDIVGRNAPPELIESAPEGVHFLGFIPDLDACFDAATLFVAPLWSGGGIKIKILEALARGAAVLTTPIGVEGIDAVADEHVLVAPDLKGFIETAATALAHPDSLLEMRKRARELARTRYDWPVIVDRWERSVARSL